MPVILWLLGVPLIAIVALMLFGVLRRLAPPCSGLALHLPELLEGPSRALAAVTLRRLLAGRRAGHFSAPLVAVWLAAGTTFPVHFVAVAVARVRLAVGVLGLDGGLVCHGAS